MRETIIDRIAFGGVKELEELYQQQQRLCPIARRGDRPTGDGVREECFPASWILSVTL
jgi:hypothetical protein